MDGSITLIAGVLAGDPIVAGSSASMVNGAIESFARAAAIELPRGLRINAVSPTVFEESMGSYGPFFRGFDPVPVARAARAFAAQHRGSADRAGLQSGLTPIPRILLALVAGLFVVGLAFAIRPDLDLAATHAFYDHGGFIGAKPMARVARDFFRIVSVRRARRARASLFCATASDLRSDTRLMGGRWSFSSPRSRSGRG